jgi:histidine triad (HIT) family protein
VVAGKVPAYIVHKDDHIVAFHDINPKAPVHILLVPARHIGELEAASGADGGAELLGRMFTTAAKIAADLRFAKNGYRLVLNNGEEAGQLVPHLHLHVMSGRKFNWPPG